MSENSGSVGKVCPRGRWERLFQHFSLASRWRYAGSNGSVRPARGTQRHLVTLLRRQRLKTPGDIHLEKQDVQFHAADAGSQQNMHQR